MTLCSPTEKSTSQSTYNVYSYCVSVKEKKIGVWFNFNVRVRKQFIEYRQVPSARCCALLAICTGGLLILTVTFTGTSASASD
jgi:hypothetical protein